MAYMYTERQLQQWDWPAQSAAWRERALHAERRAEYLQRRLERYETQEPTE